MDNILKYTTENCIAEILKTIPGFRDRWQHHLDDWAGEPAGIVLDMIELATYTTDLLQKGNEKEVLIIFTLMESMLKEGTEKLQSVISSGFLESIINPVTKDTDYLPILGNLLGEKSRAYCQEWLKFSGGDLPNISSSGFLKERMSKPLTKPKSHPSSG